MERYNHLNEDLWVEILKRLPIKTLSRFRCVSKPWDSLISSSFFIIQHHQFSSDEDCGVGKSYLINFATNGLCAFYDPRVSLAVNYPKFMYFPFQTRYSLEEINNLRVVEVIHGVVCLYSIVSPNSIILWNPTIHKFMEIPPSPFFGRRPTTSSSQVLGFGFNGDKNNNYMDFKVVRILAYRPPYPWNRYSPLKPLQPPTYEVFSTREGRWREVLADHIDPYALASYKGCFTNGSIHWVVSRYVKDDYEMVLLMFDCEREEFKTSKLPPEFNHSRNISSIFTYRGLLSTWINTESGMNEPWAMEEYDVASSWKKLSTIHRKDDFVIICSSCLYRIRKGVLRRKEKSSGTLKGLRVKEPLIGHLFEESMFLMTPRAKASLNHQGRWEGAGFGFGLYSDHHYHLGYFLKIDPAWGTKYKPQAYALMADFMNLDKRTDPSYTKMRCFDSYKFTVKVTLSSPFIMNKSLLVQST